MAEGDEDKTAFFAGEGVFCYRKMPFGLKNAGATYQSTSKEEMLADIKETFEKFQSINMKLNPKKCSFGIEEGPFLGHLITKQGIRANPSKVKAITDVGQLKTLKEVQSLNGKIAALNRFLSKGTERSLPFFKVLKSCIDKKNIQWTQEAEAALQEMKKFVEILPTLMAPGAELNFSGMEKLILALVHEAKRLRRYFQAHMITVLTNSPIKQILMKPKNLGRVAKWAIELAEHDIVFQERGNEMPKDFLIEVPLEDNKKETKEKADTKPAKTSYEWKLFTNRAMSSDSFGARLMLIDPEGK
ncbi:reverse transcriptase domain-containing protein [Tanacetum coccineum]